MAGERRKLRGSSSPVDGMASNSSAAHVDAVNKMLGASGFFDDALSKQVTDAMKQQDRFAVNALEKLDNFFAKVNKKTKEVNKDTASSVETVLVNTYDQLHKVEDKIIEVTNNAKTRIQSLEKQLKTTTDKTLAKDLRNQISEVKNDTKDALESLKDDSKGFKDEIKNIETQFNATSKAIDKGVDMIVDKMGLAKGGLVHTFGKDVSKHFTENMGKISKLQIAKMAATAVSVASISQAAMFQASGRDLIPSTGMGMKQYNQFLDIVPRVGISAHITNSEVMELGRSFANVGIPLNSTTKDLQGYLTVAGQAQRMTGLNSDQVALYTKNLMAQNFTSTQVLDSFKTMYGTMVSTNQTTQDLVQSLTMASDLVGDFGGLAHRNMFQFTNDIMLARGLFKTLGIDAKEAGNVISSSFGGNGSTALMRSGLIANTLGGSQAKIFNEMMGDPSRGAELTLQSAMTKLMQLAPTAGFSLDQMNKQFGGNQEAIRSAYLRNMNTLPAIASMYGLDPKVLQQGLSNYRASGATSIQGWMDQRKQKMQPAQSKAWDKAWDNFNAQVPELLEQMGRLGQNLMIILGSPVVRLFIPILKVTNSVLDKLALAMTSNNPLVKGLITFGSVLTGVFGIAMPLLTVFRTMLPMLGAVAGSGLLGGLTAGGLMPVLIGGAITAAVAGVAVAFGPQIVKAIGDGFNTAFSWLKGLNPFGIFGGAPTGTPAAPKSAFKMPSFLSNIFGGGGAASPKAPMAMAGNVPVGGGTKRPFGWLSAKYESGNPGTVADYMFRGRRNVAYGAWQMDAGMNTPQAYMKWAKTNDPATYGYLNPVIGSAMSAKRGAFGQRWMQMGKEHPTEFKQSQLEFMKARYLNPLINRFGQGALANPYIQEAAFSTAVQHGPGSNGRSGGADILMRAGLGKVSDANQLVRNIFAERTRVHPGTADRYNREMIDVLKAMAQDANKNHAQVINQAAAQHNDTKLEQRRTAAATSLNGIVTGVL